MKTNFAAIVFSLAIVIAAFLLGNAIVNRNNSDGIIAVTGLGVADFTSDLIVWEGSFAKERAHLKNAYNDLEKDKRVITEYLISRGIKEDELVFNAVKSKKSTKANYSRDWSSDVCSSDLFVLVKESIWAKSFWAID